MDRHYIDMLKPVRFGVMHNGKKFDLLDYNKKGIKK